MVSTHTAELNLPALPPSAKQAHLFPALQDTCLVSIGMLCDAGCEANFTKTTVNVTLNGTLILQGNRCLKTGLWNVPLQAPEHQANSIMGTAKVAEQVAFSHAALFSPSISTLEQALGNNYVRGFPGLTLHTLRKHTPNSVATAKGHLDNTRANQQSTKTPIAQPEPEEVISPANATLEPRSNACFVAIIKFEPTGQVHTDQTGPFPVTSTRGMKYIFVLYDFDSNSIHPVPIKNRTAESILEAYKLIHGKLTKAGLKPKLHRLDNECSQLLKDFMISEQEDYQLVPPGLHRRNSAERAIRTYKNHFIAGLSSTDPNFPLNLWDRLVEQSYITLNLLRGSRMNPKLSAYAQIEGEFDYNRTPLAPPGTRVLVHEKPVNRASWDPHGVDGWYIGPAMESYRCYKTYIWSTKAERITDTLQWFPHYVTMPKASDVEIIQAATQDILNTLKNPSHNSPIPALTDMQLTQLKTLTEILHTHVSNPSNLEEQISKAPTLQIPEPQQPPPAPVLRVAPLAPPAPPTELHQQQNPLQQEPLLHLPTVNPEEEKTPPTPYAEETPTENAPLLRVPTVTQEEEIPNPTQVTEEPVEQEQEFYEFIKILNHKTAPQGCGSKYEVEVEWKNYPPSYVPVNVFTEHGNNTTAWKAVTEYAEAQNLFNVKGWKQFKQAASTNHAQHAPKPSKKTRNAHKQQNLLNQECKQFFQVCLHAMESANKAINPDTGKLSEYSTLLKSSDGVHWEESCCEEVGRLAQGYPPAVPKGTDTIHFIRFDQIPAGRKATYLRLVVADRPMKANPRRVRFTVGGDKVDYPFDVRTKTADLTTAKILINSTISTPGAKFMCLDIKDFYLNNDMTRYEYMRIPVNQLPQKIIDLYNLEPLIHNGAVYVEIRKGMYGLPQAGRIANDKLVPILKAAGYHQSEHVPGLFKHNSRPVAFCLVVDDFGVQYVGTEHAQHLIETLQTAGYIITTDWEGKQFCGITLDWDYENRTVDLSMPGYVDKALQRFEHPTPTRAEDSPHEWNKPQYGAKQQMTPDPDTSPPLEQQDIKRLQEVIGTLLFYARAIDNTMLVALGTLASAQTKGTQATAKAMKKLLNYAATHPNAVIKYTASGMILHIHSDASYLSEAEARSRAGGFFYLSNEFNPSDKSAPMPKLNGAIHIVSTILQNVMASATEAEVGALFHNAQDACMLRNTLEFLGYKQPPTPIQTDNSCAEGIVNDTVKQKRSKAIDMRFYWVRDRVRQNQFTIFWRKGADNLADYFTKHHPPSHHQAMRPIYLHEPARTYLCNLMQQSCIVRVY